MHRATERRVMAEPTPSIPRRSPAPTLGGSGDAFTTWLRVSLRRVHDAVAAEPVPEALRRLAAGEDGAPRAAPDPTPGVTSAPHR
jgi:hypothetical protein